MSRKWGAQPEMPGKPPRRRSFPRGRGSGDGGRGAAPTSAPRGPRGGPGCLGGAGTSGECARAREAACGSGWGWDAVALLHLFSPSSHPVLRSPSLPHHPRPTFDARHGGDVAPGSRTRGGGGGSQGTGDSRRRRPDNTRKCTTQHFRRRLTLARGARGSLREADTSEADPFFLSAWPLPLNPRYLRLSPRVWVSGAGRDPVPG